MPSLTRTIHGSQYYRAPLNINDQATSTIGPASVLSRRDANGHDSIAVAVVLIVIAMLVGRITTAYLFHYMQSRLMHERIKRGRRGGWERSNTRHRTTVGSRSYRANSPDVDVGAAREPYETYRPHSPDAEAGAERDLCNEAGSTYSMPL